MRSLPFIFLSLLLSVAVAHAAANQTEATPTAPTAINVVTFVDVTEAAIPRAIGLLRQYREQLAGPATAIDLYQDIGRPYRFAINEQWRDREAFDAHQRGNAPAQLLTALSSLQSAPPETHILQPHSVAPERPPGGGRAKLFVISRFEVMPARLTELEALLRPLADASRRDEEGMRFDVLRAMPPRQTQVTILESWSNPEGFEAHRIAPHVQNFRAGLAPMLAGSYDERLYGKFD